MGREEWNVALQSFYEVMKLGEGLDEDDKMEFKDYLMAP